MLSFDRELVQLRDEGLLRPEMASPLISGERGEIVSIHAEVRVMAWIGVMLIVGGAGVIVSKNFDRIGPLAIATAIGVASAVCYLWFAMRRKSGRSGALDVYILLLGALLLSADTGFIEAQWHLLGGAWPRHFLLLALIHGATAYLFRSEALLALALAAIASWFGIERTLGTLFTSSHALAMRAFACAGSLAVWRMANRRREFERLFDHFIANLVFWGGLILTFQQETRFAGAAIVVIFAVLTTWYGFRRREELFVLYAFVYAVVAIDVVIAEAIGTNILVLLFLIVSTIGAIVALFWLHGRFGKAAA